MGNTIKSDSYKNDTQNKKEKVDNSKVSDELEIDSEKKKDEIEWEQLVRDFMNNCEVIDLYFGNRTFDTSWLYSGIISDIDEKSKSDKKNIFIDLSYGDSFEKDKQLSEENMKKFIEYLEKVKETFKNKNLILLLPNRKHVNDEFDKCLAKYFEYISYRRRDDYYLGHDGPKAPPNGYLAILDVSLALLDVLDSHGLYELPKNAKKSLTENKKMIDNVKKSDPDKETISDPSYYKRT